MTLGQRIAAWLAAPATAPLIARSITAMLPYLIHSLRNPDLGEFLQRTLGEQLRQADFAPIIGHGIRILTASGEADILFERAIEISPIHMAACMGPLLPIAVIAEGWVLFCFGLQGAVERHRQTMLL